MTELENLLEQAREAQAQAWEAEAAVQETLQAEVKSGLKRSHSFRRKNMRKKWGEEARELASKVRKANPDVSQARGWASHARKKASGYVVSQAPVYGRAELFRSTFKDTVKAWEAAETAWRKAAAAWEAVADAYAREAAGTPAAE